MAAALDADEEEFQSVLDLSRAEANVATMTEAEQIEEATRQSMTPCAHTSNSTTRTSAPKTTLKRSRSPSLQFEDRSSKVHASTGPTYPKPQPTGIFKQLDESTAIVSHVRSADRDQGPSLDTQLELRVAARWRGSSESDSSSSRSLLSSSTPASRLSGPTRMQSGTQIPTEPIALTRGDQAQLDLL